MLVDWVHFENIRCFDGDTLDFRGSDGRPSKWVTLLGENGAGKSTILQALALLLAGPEGASILAPRPAGWVCDESTIGSINIRIAQGPHDPGRFGKTKVSRNFQYGFALTGAQRVNLKRRVYTEPTIEEVRSRRLSWLRENAFASKGRGWFAAGYGAFRRLTRSSNIPLGVLPPAERYRNFATQFNESEPLSTFEQYLVHLENRIAREKDADARHQKELAVAALDHMLPPGTRFDHVTDEGRILFDVRGRKVATLALSDGYRSVLALTSDLVWRMILAFPTRSKPLKEEGVVLIDELDIHLHPRWQRDIAQLLREKFPGLQFIVATHSPLIAAGAGEDALTYHLNLTDSGRVTPNLVPNVSAYDVDRILQSEAFGLVSSFAPETQTRIDEYDRLLTKKGKLKPAEEKKLAELRTFMQAARPFGGPPAPGSLNARIDQYIKSSLNGSEHP